MTWQKLTPPLEVSPASQPTCVFTQRYIYFGEDRSPPHHGNITEYDKQTGTFRNALNIGDYGLDGYFSDMTIDGDGIIYALTVEPPDLILPPALMVGNGTNWEPLRRFPYLQGGKYQFGAVSCKDTGGFVYLQGFKVGQVAQFSNGSARTSLLSNITGACATFQILS